MTRMINHLLILFFVVSTAAIVNGAQDGRTIAQIEFAGLQQITIEQALATSGLKAGQPFKVEEVDAAAQRLLDLATQHDAHFVFASTSEVYGDPLEHPQRESYWGNVNPNGPRACYDES